MRTIFALSVLGFIAASAYAQRDRGAGRAGGSGVQHDTRQTQILDQNNDPRFVGYRKVIKDRLRRSVNYVSAAYERALSKDVDVSPEMFLAAQLAAKDSKVNPETLTASLASVAPHERNSVNALRTESASSAQDQLALALQHLGKMDAESAKAVAKSATDAVASVHH